MRFAIDIRYDQTPIAGISADTKPDETPDAISRRVAASYARDAKNRGVTSIDAGSLIGDVRTFVRAAAESGESMHQTIEFVDGKPRIRETRYQNVVSVTPSRDRADKVTVHLISLSDDEVAERSQTLKRLLG